MPTLHLCLVSDQLPANLIPALKLKPDSVWLASSKKMLPKARLLKKILIKQNITCELVLENLADADLTMLDAQVQEIAFKLADQYGDIILNATGGNKLMTLSFWNELVPLLKERLSVVYCDTQSNTLAHLLPQRKTEALDQVLDLKTYLAAYDYRICSANSENSEWLSKAKARKPLTKWLGKNLHKDVNFLGMLNGVAADATKAFERNDYHGAKQSFSNNLWGFRLDVLRHIGDKNYGLIEWQEGAEAITFSGLDAARYLSGAWLEEYAWFCAKDAGAFDAHCGVQVSQAETENELDCAIVHNNRMLVIECKTASFSHNGKDVQNVLHKLDNISTHLGGLFAKRMLLSVRTLRSDEDYVRQRAKSYQIQLVEGEDVANLQEKIKHWIGN